MTESVVNRVKRIISAKVEDKIYTMEKAGGAALMRQSIIEANRAMEDVKIERDEATGRRLQAVRQQKLYQDRLESLTEKAEFALEEGREDLAKAALTRQVEFEEQIERLKDAEETASNQERNWQEAFAQLELRAEHMKAELQAFEQVQSDADMGVAIADPRKREAARKVECAEEAFSRAMKGSTGFSGAPIDISATRSLAELETLQRGKLIDQRLEALKMKKAS